MSVVYTLTDPTGLPLDAAGSNTPGAVTLAYVASYIPQGQKQYVGYTTASATGSVLGTVTRPFFELPSFGTGGTVTPIGPGQYKYTFKAKAPANFDPTVTTTVAVDGNRDLTLFDVGSATQERPSTSSPTANPSRRCVMSSVPKAATDATINWRSMAATRMAWKCACCATSRKTPIRPRAPWWPWSLQSPWRLLCSWREHRCGPTTPLPGQGN